jgi:peptidyl-dipeptidase Dcp
LAKINPLLASWKGPLGTPNFATVDAADFLLAFDVAIEESRREISAITICAEPPNFENTVAALERSGSTLARVRRIFWMLSSAHSSGAIRAIEAEVGAKLTAWGTEVGHDARLFERVKGVWQNRAELGPEEARLTDISYKGFIAGGANLGSTEKERFAQINSRLSELSVRFGQNVLAATNDCELPVEANKLGGIPADITAPAAALAAQRGLSGRFLFVLDRGVYEALLTSADDRTVREQVWRRFTSRCQSGDHDNLPIAAEIAALRQEKAALLGYADYASYALEDSMAKTPAAAEELMSRVWKPALAQAHREAKSLQSLMDENTAGATLEAWDWRYFSEQLRRERFAYDSVAIRQHLKLSDVRSAAFSAAQRLYGLTFDRRHDVSVYHPDVCAWSVADEEKQIVGVLFTDYIARPEKHGGAWMGSLRVQEKMNGREIPIVYTVANFTGSGDESGIFLSLDEARTLFHEFGHALHALLSDVTYPSLAGTAVATDFVEFPSKLMEHWIADPACLRGFGIAPELADAVARAETFGQGFATVEFMASALVDLALHRTLPAPSDIARFETDTLAELGLPAAIGMRHRLAYFTHIFDGGYGSAYYSYLWSEVLDADTFEAFEAAGDIFDSSTADRLRREVLGRGNSRDPLESFVAFRGREPDENALLRARCLA